MDFNYKLKIGADKEEVFSALTNPFQIALWSGYPADMQPEAGYEFSLWEGDITGKNMEVIPNKKLVQEWYFGDTEKRSIVSIELKGTGGSTMLELRHINIPDEVYDEIVEGWKEYYLGSMKDMLEMI
ncbi:MAG: SRPBCC domain-containing protein [Marinifilaceae bacterium]